MEAHMEQMEPVPMVYMRRVGPYGAENNQLMAAMKSWARAKGLMKPGSIIYGIAWDNESAPPSQRRYDVCLAAPGLRADGEVSEEELAGGKYAVFAVEHTAQAVREFWAALFRELEQAGCSLDVDRPILERYDYETVERGYCELCVPVLQEPA